MGLDADQKITEEIYNELNQLLGCLLCLGLLTFKVSVTILFIIPCRSINKKQENDLIMPYRVKLVDQSTIYFGKHIILYYPGNRSLK